MSLKNQLEPIFSSFADKLQKSNSVITEVSFDTIKELAIFLNALNNYLFDISSATQDDYIKNRFEIVTALERYNNQFLNIWSKIAGIYLSRNDNLDKERKRIGEEYDKISHVLNEKIIADAIATEKIMMEMRDKIFAFDKRLSDVYSKGEISQQEKRFMQTADFNNKQSYIWIAIIALLSIILTIICYYFISACWIDFSCVTSDGLKDISQQRSVLIYELARKSFLRILILSIIIFLIKFSVKNYNALKHNFVINRHKENSLDAALNLMYNLPEGVGRDAIINMAAKEIFTQHQTGFLGKDHEKIDISLLEQLLSLANKKEK